MMDPLMLDILKIAGGIASGSVVAVFITRWFALRAKRIVVLERTIDHSGPGQAFERERLAVDYPSEPGAFACYELRAKNVGEVPLNNVTFLIRRPLDSRLLKEEAWKDPIDVPAVKVSAVTRNDRIYECGVLHVGDTITIQLRAGSIEGWPSFRCQYRGEGSPKFYSWREPISTLEAALVGTGVGLVAFAPSLAVGLGPLGSFLACTIVCCLVTVFRNHKVYKGRSFFISK